MAELRIILKRDQNTEDCYETSVTLPVWLTQSNLDGINNLICWLEGFRRSSPAIIPGEFELIMLHRQIVSAIQKHNKEQT